MPETPHRPLLLGHRGARGENSIPENSLQAFDFALAQGCHGFEFDVRLSMDGKPVISHDPKVRGREVARSSASDLNLPDLDYVLRGYRSKAFLDIELKVSGLESLTLNSLRAWQPSRGYVISSFLPEILLALHTLDPNVPLGLICDTIAQFERWPLLPVQYVMPHHKLLREDTIETLHDAEKKVFAWTVNAPAQIKRFTDWGVDGIISDHPDLLVRMNLK